MSSPIKKTFLVNSSWTAPAKVGFVDVECLRFSDTSVSLTDPAVDNLNTSTANIFLDSNGIAFSCGLNSAGLLGIGNVTPQSSPIAVLGGFQFSRIFCDQATTWGIPTKGTLVAWGANASGQLGDGTVIPKSSPVAVLGGLTFKSVTAPSNPSGCAILLTESGVAYGIGSNLLGQLGVGDVIPRSSPVAVLGGLTFAKVFSGTSSAFFGLTHANQLYGWGINSAGFLGVGDVTPRSSPVAVLGGITFADVVAQGTQVMALDTSGNAWGWGNNSSTSPLGVGDFLPHSSPVQVLGGLKFKKVYGWGNSWFGLQADGTLYTWGQGNNSLLGTGNLTAQSSPVAVIGGHKFRLMAGSIANDAVFAITTDNDLYSWGLNFSGGILGTGGSNAPSSSPVLVLGGLKWSWVWANIGGMGVTLDGDLYTWGANSNGCGGVGDVTPRSSPVLILGGLRMKGLFYMSKRTIPVIPGTSYDIHMNDQFTTFGSHTVAGGNQYSRGAFGSTIVNLYYKV